MTRSLEHEFYERGIKVPWVAQLPYILSQIFPFYSDEDEPHILQYEAKGGKHAPPGSLSLKEHDLLHVLLGLNIVHGDKTNKKDLERFITGFTYGASAECSRERYEQFLKDTKEHFPKHYHACTNSEEMLEAGYEWGEAWLELDPLQGVPLEKMLETAVKKNWSIEATLNEFYRDCPHFECDMNQYLDEYALRDGVNYFKHYDPRDMIAKAAITHLPR
ncbi:MAG: hypothetical protein AAF244_04460 [Pseudomonadota bacterium]